MITVALLSILISSVVWVIFLMRKRYQYFKQAGIKYNEPVMFFGNAYETVVGKKHQSQLLDELYMTYPEEELVGYYLFTKAQLVARSPELVHDILVKNFSNFSERVASGRDEKIKTPFDANLFALNGNTWRIARNRFSPLFTSGKLKFMYHSIADCGKNLVTVLDKYDGQEVDISDVMGLFSMDVIGSTAFGLEAKTLENPDSQFRAMGKKIFDGSFLSNIMTIIFIMLPKVAKKLGIRGIITERVGNYFIDILKKTMELRKQQGTERNDFVQMLLHLKEKGKVEIQVHDPGDDYLKVDENVNDVFELEMSDELLLGGALTFFTAGLHATSMTLSFALFELARYPEVADRLMAEIKEAVKGDEPTYEELKEMPYLEKVVKETMRLYPTAPVLSRTCTKEFRTPRGTVIKPGMQVMIPALSLQKDPAYWSEPEAFRPDRFQADCPPQPGTYIPFGDGPRICIAMRFAMLEVKYALVKLLKNYNFELSEKTSVPLKINPRIFLMTPKDGIFFRVTKIQ